MANRKSPVQKAYDRTVPGKGAWVVTSCRDMGTESVEADVARFVSETAALDDMIAREKAYDGCGLTFSVVKRS